MKRNVNGKKPRGGIGCLRIAASDSWGYYSLLALREYLKMTERRHVDSARSSATLLGNSVERFQKIAMKLGCGNVNVKDSREWVRVSYDHDLP